MDAAPQTAQEFLDWVADLTPTATQTTLTEVVATAQRIRTPPSGPDRSGADEDWHPPFLSDETKVVPTRPRPDPPADQKADEPADDPAPADEPASRLFAPTEINAIYRGPGARPPGGGATPPPAAPAGPRPSGPGPAPGNPPPAYRPPPGYPPAYGAPAAYPPAYAPPAYAAPAYPAAPYPAASYPAAPYPAPGYPGSAAPPYGPPPQYAPPAYPPAAAQPVPSPYFDPNAAPGAGLTPAWDALPAHQRTEHFVGLPGWAQTQLWGQMNGAQRQELAALLPPRG